MYGARSGGTFIRSKPLPGKPETIPSWTSLPFADVCTQLAANPRSFSVLDYNGTNHFDAFVFGEKRKGDAAIEPKKKAKPIDAPPAGDLSPLVGSIVGRRVLVLSTIWPDYACNENGGQGWSGVVMRAGKGWADVRFIDAHDESGKKYADERLEISVLRPL